MLVGTMESDTQVRQPPAESAAEIHPSAVIAVALVALAFWLLLLKQSRTVTAAQMGQHLLNALGILSLVFCTFAGIFLTADCLAEEKREGCPQCDIARDLAGRICGFHLAVMDAGFDIVDAVLRGRKRPAGVLGQDARELIAVVGRE